MHENCSLCQEKHTMKDCAKFLEYTNVQRLEFVKNMSLCFNCLLPGHRCFECTMPRCNDCNREHNKLLHNWERTPNYINNGGRVNYNSTVTYMNSDENIEKKSDIPKRAFLPIVRAKVKTMSNTITATMLLDSASEVVIVSKRLAKALNLKGTPIVIDTVGVGAVVMQQVTEKVEFFVEDLMGNEVYIEAIILEKTCGQAVPVSTSTCKQFSE